MVRPKGRKKTRWRWLARLLSTVLVVCVAAASAGAYALFWRPLEFAPSPQSFDIKSGSSMKSVAKDLRAGGVVPFDWPFVALARASGHDRGIKAGNYALESGLTPWQLLQKLTEGDVTQDALTVVEGWNFAQLREVLRTNPRIKQTLDELSDAEVMRRIGATEAHPEGLFFPDTYFFTSGTSDVVLLKRAYRTMRERLAAAWTQRDNDLPYASPYEALIMASIIEKETARAGDRPLVASVFVNRLRQGMKLQTDPAVIYGIGAQFDGDLRKRDLVTDTNYNTYTRDGLPPTPIALPGQASLVAALHPPQTRYLYFVAKGDGSSVFSTTLADHARAVAKYQRGGR